MLSNKRRSGGFTLIELMIVIAIIAILAAILVPNFIRARAQGQLTACKSNCKNLGTALEMYSTDWNGKYPAALSGLIPNYLKVIPECPSAGTDTYSTAGYATVDPNAIYINYYEYACVAANHQSLDIAGDYPTYDAVGGLVERP